MCYPRTHSILLSPSLHSHLHLPLFRLLIISLFSSSSFSSRISYPSSLEFTIYCLTLLRLLSSSFPHFPWHTSTIALPLPPLLITLKDYCFYLSSYFSLIFPTISPHHLSFSYVFPHHWILFYSLRRDLLVIDTISEHRLNCCCNPLWNTDTWWTDTGRETETERLLSLLQRGGQVTWPARTHRVETETVTATVVLVLVSQWVWMREGVGVGVWRGVRRRSGRRTKTRMMKRRRLICLTTAPSYPSLTGLY